MRRAMFLFPALEDLHAEGTPRPLHLSGLQESCSGWRQHVLVELPLQEELPANW